MSNATTIENARPADVDPWRMAYSALHEMGLSRGLRVTTAWMWAAMGLSQVPARNPGESDVAFARRAQSWNLRVFKPQMDQIVEHILAEHGLYLRSIGAGPNRPGEWELLDGRDAPDLVKRAAREIQRQLSTTKNTVSSLSVDGLTSQQVADRDDSIAKLSYLEKLMRKRRGT